MGEEGVRSERVTGEEEGVRNAEGVTGEEGEVGGEERRLRGKEGRVRNEGVRDEEIRGIGIL